MAKIAFNKPGGVALAEGQEVATPVIEVSATVTGQEVATAPTIQVPAQPAAQTAPATSVPAVIPPSAPPAPRSVFSDDEYLDPRDMVISSLKIVQKVGDLSNVFPGGTILLGSQSGNLVLVKAPAEATKESDKIRLVIMGTMPKRYVEKVPFGTQGGNEFDNEADVVRVGGTLDYNESVRCQKPLYQTYIQAIGVLEQPAGTDDNSFNIELAGKRYSLFRYGMKGTSYTNAAKHFLSARKIGHLRQGFRAGFWTFSSVLRSFNGQYYYAPVVRAAEPTSEAFRTELTSQIGF